MEQSTSTQTLEIELHAATGKLAEFLSSALCPEQRMAAMVLINNMHSCAAKYYSGVGAEVAIESTLRKLKERGLHSSAFQNP